MGSVGSFLLMYGSQCMRHIGFRRLTVVNGTLGFWAITKIIYIYIYIYIYRERERERERE